ncbi:hypothetical protein CURTO8I2_60120 [Curtobacterium sp. 8I-2]|nr:hypothetical protein CURTO8I2_60120 [Curtobacterium sp. 8I-2]
MARHRPRGRHQGHRHGTRPRVARHPAFPRLRRGRRPQRHRHAPLGLDLRSRHRHGPGPRRRRRRRQRAHRRHRRRRLGSGARLASALVRLRAHPCLEAR